ncbi:RNA_polymerase III RPC4 family protein [Hexamita inflata]|uniref:RNA polymerase III RPC4 family protein n=1 Tax=Hexamita inflata TaxID=28002 RepID=A0AA86QSM8_9EUKA|nr:RNA polymerase III RPC4 family protein [Hexamita inflata]
MPQILPLKAHLQRELQVEGRIGKLQQFKSGKMKIVLENGIEYEVFAGQTPDFYQQIVAVDTKTQVVQNVGKVDGKVQLWEVELLFLVYYVSNYILKYFATSNADDKFQQIISSWRLFMNYSLTQEGQKYDFDRIRPQSTIQSRYLIFQKGKIEITTCNKRTAMTKINAVEDVQGRSTNSLNKLRQF